MQDTENKDKIKRSIKLGEASAIGIEIVAAIVIGAVGGKWLDGKFGTFPYLTVFGLLTGIGAATKAVMRVIKRFNEEESESEKNDGDKPKPPF